MPMDAHTVVAHGYPWVLKRFGCPRVPVGAHECSWVLATFLWLVPMSAHGQPAAHRMFKVFQRC